MSRTYRIISLFLIKAALLGSAPAQGQAQKNASTTLKPETSAATQAPSTPGRIAKFTGTKTVGDSNITEDASGKIGINTTLPTSQLTVNGIIEMMGADRQTRNRFIFHGYLARSRYADQLEWWCDAFPHDQLLLLRSEDLFADPAGVLARTCRFLDLPVFELAAYDVENEGTGDRTADGAIDAELRRWLDDYFAEPNLRLADLTATLPGGPITWP